MSGRLFRQRRSDRADSRHGRRGLHLRTLNVLPREAVQLCELFFSGDVRGAAALQCRLLPVIDALFSEVNPIPVKAALAKNGLRHRHAASAAHPDGGRKPGRPSERARSMGCLR